MLSVWVCVEFRAAAVGDDVSTCWYAFSRRDVTWMNI